MSVPHSPVPAYAAAIAGIALFSIMDMVMKSLTLAIGTYPTLLWRSLIGIGLAAIPYLVTRNPWPRGTALKLHLRMGYTEQGRIMNIYKLFGRWRFYRETRYSGSRLEALRKPSRPPVTATVT